MTDVNGNGKKGIKYDLTFAPSLDPFEGIEMSLRDVVLTNEKTKEVTFEQRDIVTPKEWGDHQIQIFAQHYLRGQLGAPERETSVLQSIDRVANTITRWAMEGRRMPDGSHLFLGQLFDSQESAAAFRAELARILAVSRGVFNSPVWYNIGVLVPDPATGGEREVSQQASACFILASDRDSMERIADWYREEIRIFKGGSGSGINVSMIRSSYEGISGGGKASGPCRYMTAADSSAGTMASGGRSRRAAKMVVLNCDHPDLIVQANGAEGFIWLKSKAEQIAFTLKEKGFDVSVDSGHDAIHIQYQNANNSVRYTEAFMEAMLADEEWQMVARSKMVWRPLPKYKAREIWRQHAKASWECGDPGIQFDTTVNHWHTTPAAGRINGSNPCSEYMHLDNSPCNLANTNLIKFLREDGSWDTEKFTMACRTIAIAQTVLAAYADYPTDEIAMVARGFRQIGQGYTNLGAVFMLLGLSYDSMVSRSWAAAITSQMQAAVVLTSAEIAAVWGSYQGVPELDMPGFDHPQNRAAQLNVVQMHSDFNRAIAKVPTKAARKRSLRFGDEYHIDIFHNEVVGGGEPVRNDLHLRRLVMENIRLWQEAQAEGLEFGYANAYWSNIPPMGTSGIVMGQATSGGEPLFNQVVTKKKVDGSWMRMANPLVIPTLLKLGYSLEHARAVAKYVGEKNSVVGAPHLREDHYPVFDTANAEPISGRYLSVEAHILMMAAMQPFLSGAISKTINLPHAATVEDFERAHMLLWRTGNKAGALYRDGSKATQPLVAAGKGPLAGPPPTNRVKLAKEVETKRIKLRIPQPGGAPFEAYMHVGFYPNGQLGELFMTAGNEGTLINGILAGAVKWGSLGAQHGVPAREMIKLWRGMNFTPNGLLSPEDSAFTSCTSLLDLAAQELALVALSPEDRRSMGILTREERKQELSNGNGKTIEVPAAEKPAAEITDLGDFGDIPFCYAETCGGVPMEKIQGCWACPQCGGTDGCS